MPAIKDFLREAKTRFYQSFVNNPVRIKPEQAIISMSFDDVPHSALENGVPILDRHSIKATFYIASGLSRLSPTGETRDMPESYISDAEVKELDQAGHDIACHTYSHYRLEEGSARAMERDSMRNTATLGSLLGGKKIEHFSYPFGQVSFAAKRLLSRHYKTMRSSRPGINSNLSDLYLLRAISIYNPTFNRGSIQSAIDTVVANGGWLIFYTHGVDESPDAYSCTPEQLDWVLARSMESGARMLPVSTAYELITGHQ